MKRYFCLSIGLLMFVSLYGQSKSSIAISIRTSETNRYVVKMNNRESGEMTREKPFSGEVPVQTDTEISICLSSGTQVFLKTIRPESSPISIEYRAAGSIQVKATDYAGVEVMIDGTNTGQADPYGFLRVWNISANVDHIIKVIYQNMTICESTIRLREGEAFPVLIGEDRRNLFFVLKIIPIGMSAGIGYYPVRFLNLGIDAGCLFLLSENSLIPYVDVSAMGEFQLDRLSRISAGVLVKLDFANSLNISPGVLGRFEWNRFFIEAGLRFPFNTNTFAGYSVGAPKLLLMAGYRF